MYFFHFLKAIYFTIFLLALSESVLAQNEDVVHSDKLFFGTAPRDGEYYDVGHSISKLLQSKEIARVEVKETFGSVDNLRKLKSGELHFGIVQSDVLHDYQRNRIEGIRNEGQIGSMASLFPEYVQLLVRKDKLKQYRNLLRLAGKKVYFGNPGSGTERNAKAIMSLYKLDPEKDFTRVKGTRKNALYLLKEGEIDAVLATSGEWLNDDNLALVGFDQDFSQKLLNQFPYLNSMRIINSFQNTYVPYTRAVLVARYRNEDLRQGIESQIVFNITKSIHEGWYEIQKQTSKNVHFFPQQLIARKVSLELHKDSYRFYRQIELVSEFRTEFAVTLVILGGIFLASIVRNMPVTFSWVHNFFQSSRFYWFRDNHTWCAIIKRLEQATCSHSWTIMLWGFAFILVFDVAIILHYEEVFAHENDVTNPFYQKSVQEIIFWLLTFAVTGFNQNIFPNSDVARFSAIIIPIAAVIGALFIVIHETMKKGRIQDRQQRGEVLPTFKDAVVICGWNDRVPSLINNLLSPYAPKKSFKKIVVVAESSQQKPIEYFGLDSNRVSFYRGISSSYETLVKGRIELSYCSVVVADENKIKKGNQRGLLTVSAIRDITSKNGYMKYPIIAEAFFPQNLRAFDAYSVKRLVCLRSYSTRLLTHALLNPGVSELLLNMLSFNPPYQLGEITSEEHNYLNKSYYEIAKDLRQNHNKLLLCTYQHSEKLIHKPLELNFRKDTPYSLANKKGKVSGCDTLITKNHSLICLDTVAGKNHDSSLKLISDSFDAVDKKTEKFIIIGNSDVAISIYKKLKNIGSTVRYIIVDENFRVNGSEYENLIPEDKDVAISDDLYKDLSESKVTIDVEERVLVVAPPLDQNSAIPSVFQDDESLKVISALNTWFKLDKKVPLPHIAAEVRELKNKELFFNAGVKQIIPTNKLIELLLTRMVYHNGRISGFILKSMSYDSENTMCRIEKWTVLKLQKHLANEILGQNFDQIVETCLKNGIQLLAIEATNENGVKQIILNPEEPSDMERGITGKDKVYIFVNT